MTHDLKYMNQPIDWCIRCEIYLSDIIWLSSYLKQLQLFSIRTNPSPTITNYPSRSQFDPIYSNHLNLTYSTEPSQSVSICLRQSHKISHSLNPPQSASLCLNQSQPVTNSLNPSECVSISLNLSPPVTIGLNLSLFVSNCRNLSQIRQRLLRISSLCHNITQTVTHCRLFIIQIGCCYETGFLTF